MTSKEEVHNWYRNQIEKFAEVLPSYKLYAETLQKVLEKIAKKFAPEAIVQTRPKAITSFAEKIFRKSAMGKDPINEFTDLCGGRIIVHTSDEVQSISEFIEQHFDIDWKNSVDASQRLKTTEFGYRSIHYIIQFKADIFPTRDINVKIPQEIFGLKAEIQVRTILEHAWADFSHDKSYKSAFKIPDKWVREFATIAANLEGIDGTFLRINAGLQRYAANYSNYMTVEQMKDEIEKLDIILDYDPMNSKIAYSIGKLALILGDWQKTIEVLSPFIDSDDQPILRDLGVALCKAHKTNKGDKEYLKGQECLERAIVLSNKDTDAIISYANTWKGINDDKVRELYHQAFELDPTDPYVLGNYLVNEIIFRKDISPVSLLSYTVNASIQRCYDQKSVGMNIPWALYDIGKFYLLLGKPYESLFAHALAIRLSIADEMIATSLRSLETLAVLQESLAGYEWVRKLLIIGLTARLKAKGDSSNLNVNKQHEKTILENLKKLSSASNKPLQEPIIIVSGGWDNIELQPEYQQLLKKSFKDFKGTIISSGIVSGIGRVIGEIQQMYPNNLRTIGYVPEQTRDVQDKRYSEIRYTKSNDLCPLQYWIDLFASGIHPSQIRLLGLNGGKIAAVEHRIALTFGAHVAIIQDGNNETEKLLSDPDWNSSKLLLPLPKDPLTIKSFIGSTILTFDNHIREIVAREIHETYRAHQLYKLQNQKEPSLAEWDNLMEHLKEYNRKHVDHILEKLQLINCTINEIEGQKIKIIKFTDAEIEIMAEMEHANWNIERLLDGWKLGNEKDVTRKISPYLVPWSELSEEMKEIDREMVRNIPEILAKVKLEVQRKV